MWNQNRHTTIKEIWLTSDQWLCLPRISSEQLCDDITQLVSVTWWRLYIWTSEHNKYMSTSTLTSVLKIQILTLYIHQNKCKDYAILPMAFVHNIMSWHDMFHWTIQFYNQLLKNTFFQANKKCPLCHKTSNMHRHSLKEPGVYSIKMTT